MCMLRNKVPDTPTPAPAPTVQTDDATTTTGEEWFAKKRKAKRALIVQSYLLQQLALRTH